MLLYVALKAVCPGSTQALTRPNGPIVMINRHMSVKVITRYGNINDWRPCFGDLVAEDWGLIDLAEMQAAREAEAAGK